MHKIYDESFGIIPLQKINDRWHVLLVQLHAGHWGFPKGHADPGETSMQAAERELLEETGLHVTSLIETTNLEENYVFKYEGNLIVKKVTYFLAEVDGTIVIQEEEIKAIAWVLLEDAYDKMTFMEGKNLISKIIPFRKN